MATVDVIKAIWTTTFGGLGLSQWAFEDLGTVPDGAFTALDGFLGTVGGLMPAGQTVQLQQHCDTFDAGTGQLIGTKSAATGFTSKAGPGVNGSWAAGVGATATWETGDIRNGRRLRGRTFLVPLWTGAFGVGQLGSTAQANLQAAATIMVNACASAGHPLQVWSRPTAKHPVGGLSTVISATVKSQTATLRGRRT